MAWATEWLLPWRSRKKPSTVRSPEIHGRVALVDVAGDQRRRMRVGAGDEERVDAADVGREPRRVEGADEGLGRHQHLAAEMAALLLRRELVLEMDAGGARLDHRLHQFEGVERPAEAGLGVGDDRREPVGRVVALEPRDLVGALEASC